MHDASALCHTSLKCHRGREGENGLYNEIENSPEEIFCNKKGFDMIFCMVVGTASLYIATFVWHSNLIIWKRKQYVQNDHFYQTH